MSTIFEILPFIGVLLGLLASAYAFMMVLRQRRAELKLQRRLLEEEVYQALLRKRSLLVHAQEHSMSEEELDELMRVILKELAYLKEQDRERIEEALYQPSARGRNNYIYKLVTETGRTLEVR